MSANGGSLSSHIHTPGRPSHSAQTKTRRRKGVGGVPHPGQGPNSQKFQRKIKNHRVAPGTKKARSSYPKFSAQDKESAIEFPEV